jgi:catechol 2,3-dioxygenase-like lactoylglutathione lyase family enzyme
MATAIHHSVIAVSDLESSLRFYRDGLGLDVLQDRHVEGDWPDLFDAPGRVLRAVFLGQTGVADDQSGVLELNAFEGSALPPAVAPGLRAGFLLLSYFVDVDEVVDRLEAMGLGGQPRRVVQSTRSGEVAIVVVRDPDGVRILLTPGSITQHR